MVVHIHDKLFECMWWKKTAPSYSMSERSKIQPKRVKRGFIKPNRCKNISCDRATVVKTDGIDIDGCLYHLWLLDQSLFGNHLIGSFTCCCSAVAETLVVQSCYSTDRERCLSVPLVFGNKHEVGGLLAFYQYPPSKKGISIVIFNTDLDVNGYKLSLPAVKTCFVIDKPKKTFACFVFYKG